MSVRKQQGFTIFELMVVLAIAALLAAFAVPAFQELTAKSRVSGAAEEISTAMVTARNLAITSRRPIMFGMSGSAWSISQATTTSTLIDLHRGVFSPSVAVAWPATQLTFDSNGRVSQTVPSAPTAAGWTVSVCDTASRSERGRNVTVSRIGRILTTTHANASTCNP